MRYLLLASFLLSISQVTAVNHEPSKSPIPATHSKSPESMPHDQYVDPQNLHHRVSLRNAIRTKGQGPATINRFIPTPKMPMPSLLFTVQKSPIPASQGISPELVLHGQDIGPQGLHRRISHHNAIRKKGQGPVSIGRFIPTPEMPKLKRTRTTTKPSESSHLVLENGPRQPGFKQPESKQPESKQPESKKPESKKPESKKPEFKLPPVNLTPAEVSTSHPWSFLSKTGS